MNNIVMASWRIEQYRKANKSQKELLSEYVEERLNNIIERQQKEFDERLIEIINYTLTNDKRLKRIFRKL